MKNLILVILISYCFRFSNAVQYECKYEAHEYYWCKVQSGKILKKSEIDVTNVFGSHKHNKGNNDVQFFDARGILTRYFPRGLDKFFPNIIETYFEDGIREIHKEDLQQFPKLRSFFMSNSNVEYLEKDLFIYNPNLVLVFFNLNNIKYVDPHVFDNLNHLTYLGFDRNYCHSGLVENNRQKTLDLIEEINENCRKKIKKTMRYNLFIKIFLLIFTLTTVIAVEFYCDYSGSYACKVYNTTINSLDDVYVTGVSGIHAAGKTNANVNIIDTREIIIRYFPKNIQKFFPNIEIIYIESGLYEVHKEDIGVFTKLKILYMSYNHIEYLEKNLFANNPNLELIYFEVNNIKYVDPNVFDNLTQLKTLSLYRNNCFSGRALYSRSEVLNLIGRITSSCTVKLIPQETTIAELTSEYENLLLVNGNLTTKCAKNLFIQNSESIIKIV